MKDGYSSVIFSSAYLHFSNENLIKTRDRFLVHEENGISFVFVKTMEYKNNGATRVLNMVSFMLRLFSVSRTYIKGHARPDVIIASSPHLLTSIAGIIIAKRLNIPCICEIRDLWPEMIFGISGRSLKSITGRILTSLEYWIYKHADALIFTKEGDVEYIKEHKWDTGQGGGIALSKCHYINNGVDINSFNTSMMMDTLDDTDLSDANTFKVVYTGTIRLANNVENIIDAAVLLREHEDIKFLIYGDGSEAGRIKARVESERLENVRIKGYIEKKHIPYVLSKSSVNLLNYMAGGINWSRGNSSNKLFEYMASAKPVIANVKMGYSIIDKYKCGISIEKNTPEELAKAILLIKNMSRSEYDKLCDNAYNGAKSFDFSILAEKLRNTIVETIAQGKKKR